eukprot:comp22477_c0_seq3/m.55601 comp22477_c0_seq3/g.55601  ORF comp22477_c0_seq3/g.55601 comp22477_c0_seq3/m.55601 type:complete len:879 (+) comp22477_c0_seq3:28-2664(+)
MNVLLGLCLTGLCYFNAETQYSGQVPLKAINYSALVIDSIAQVVIEQTYTNTELTPIESVFKFPLDDNAAVSAFSAIIDGVEIKGIVKEKEQAFRDYDAAIARGDGAYLAEEDKADIFSMSVGNLPPGKTVTIRLTYVTRLGAEGDDLRFVLPLAMVPRYTPGTNAMAPTDSVSQMPPVGGAGADYPITIAVDAVMSSSLVSVTSPSHTLAVAMGSNARTARITLATSATLMNKDFVALLKTSAPYEPQAALELNDDGSNGAAAMVSLFPLFKTTKIPTEIIFVVDRSGSMGGTKIEQTKNALQLFLRSMPAGSKFNIVSFGSSASQLFSGGAQDYNQNTMRQAVDHVASMSANMGGTEILSALKMVFGQKLHREYLRQVFVLTDGEVDNNDAVFAAVRDAASTMRVFSFGIGDGASRALVNGIARAGRGMAEFIANDERIEPKVMRQLRRAVQPVLGDVQVSWAKNGQPLVGFEHAPHVAPPVFASDRFVSYALFPSAEMVPDSVTLRGTTFDGPVEATIAINLAQATQGSVVHTIAARELIRELEEGGPGAPAMQPPQQPGSRQQRSFFSGIFGQAKAQVDAAVVTPVDARTRVIQLATKYNLASKYTSFVAVEYRDNKVSSTHMQLRNVPVPAAQQQQQQLQQQHLQRAHVLNLASNDLADQAKMFTKSAKKSGGSGFFGNMFGTRRKSSASAPMRSAAPAPSGGAAPQRESIVCDAICIDEEGDNDDVFEDKCMAPPPPPPAESAYCMTPPAPPMAAPAAAPGGGAPAPVSPFPSRPDELVLLQTWDGSWPAPTPRLLQLLGISASDFNVFVATNAGLSSDQIVWITAFAVARLELTYAAQRVEWEMLVDKAVSGFLGGRANLVAAAKSYLASH